MGLVSEGELSFAHEGTIVGIMKVAGRSHLIAAVRKEKRAREISKAALRLFLSGNTDALVYRRGYLSES